MKTSRLLPIWAFTVLLGAGTVLSWAFVARGLSAVPAPFRVPWPVLAACFAFGHRAGIRVEFGKEGHKANLADAVLIPSIVFVGASGVILAAIIGTLAYAVWVRRSVVKAAFNVCAHALGTTVAVICFHLVAGSSSALSARTWFGAVIAVLAVSVVTDVAIQVVIALSTAHFDRSKLGPLALFVVAMVGLNSALGLAAVLMVYASPVLGIILSVVVGTAIGVGYSTYGRLRMRHDRLRQLHRFNQALAGVIDTDDVIRAVLGEARALLNAGVAQLIVAGPAGVICHTLGATDEDPTSASLSGRDFVELLACTARGAPTNTPTSDAGAVHAAEVHGLRDAAAVRLPSETSSAEVLIVADRLGDQISFDAADLTLLDALAGPAAIALRSADLHALKDHQASHDALTGLANRSLFASVLDRAVRDRPDDSLVGVMLLDLDGFKEVNDTRGHDIGDQFLQHLADRLRAVVGDRGLIARLGGDEFAVALPHEESVAQVVTLADQLSIAVQAPIWVADIAVDMRASIGITVAPLHGDDRSILMRRADSTMYRAKRQGGGVAVHDNRRDDIAVHHPSLVSELRDAIRSSTLTVGYQPVADMRTGQVTGVEALLRWVHPTYGPISPDRFIPLAERSGLIGPLTHWVLDTAITQLAVWREHSSIALNLSVNLSPCLLDNPDIVGQVRRLLDIHHIPSGALTMELTESSVGGERIDDHRVLDHFAGAGVRLSIDDYGTGYSSLTRLKDLPVSELKIDRSFITDMVTNPATDAIVASTIDLAHKLGVIVVAEGVESHDTWQRLRELGCDAAQGFLLAPALPGHDLANWLQNHRPSSIVDSNIIAIRTA